MKKLTITFATFLSFAIPSEMPVPFSINTIKKAPPVELYPYQKIIVKYCKKYNVNPRLVVALITQESKFNHNSYSDKGAVGIMQLMPKTAMWLGVDPHAVESNIEGGIRYLAICLNKYKNIKLALAAYNAGPGAVHKYNNTIPPFKQTQEYVKNICENYKQCERFSSSTILG